MFVSIIRIGHVIVTDSGKFTVTGNMKLRGRYLYTAKTESGRKVSLSRDDVLQAQREGTARVIAAY